MLQIDEKALINDVIIALNREMDSIAEILVQFMIGEIVTNGNVHPEWKADVIQALKWKSVAVTDAICKEVGILDQSDPIMYKAMAVNFGTGLEASTDDNPWFGEFKSSKFYHKSRGDMQIYSLPGEEVYDPESDSWKLSTAKTRQAYPQFAQVGSKFWTDIFGNSATMAETYFNEAIEKAMNSIDFSKYLISRGD